MGQAEAGQHEQTLQHLGEEREAEQQARAGHPRQRRTTARRLDGAHDEVGRRGHQEHKHRVRIVEPEHERRHGCQRDECARDDAGEVAGPAPHRAIRQGDCADAHQGLREQHGEAVETEDSSRQHHHPQRGRWLVDGDRIAAVQRAEQPCLPVLRAGFDCGSIELVRVSGVGQLPQIERCREGKQAEQRRAGPVRIAVSAPHESRPATRPVRRAGCMPCACVALEHPFPRGRGRGRHT